MFRRFAPLAALCLLAFAAFTACDEASPLAPAGTTLEVSISPTQVGLTGTATVTVIGRRGNGGPLFPGTEIRLSVSRGSVTPLVTTDAQGIAVGTFSADGRSGAATVTASAGGATDTADVQVGLTTDSKPQLELSVNPASIAIGEQATITVIARNSDGSSIGAGQTVLFTTTLGSLNPSQAQTNASGIATSRLTSGTLAGNATVSALLGSSDTKSTTVIIRDSATAIDVQSNPRTVPASGGTVTLTAFVTNARGQALQGAPVTFAAERGTLSKTLEFTGSNGVASVTLTVTQDQLVGVDSFTVEVSTPTEGGGLLRDEDEITVQ